MRDWQAASDVSKLDKTPTTDGTGRSPESVVARANDASYAASYDSRNIAEWRSQTASRRADDALASVRANNAGWPPRVDFYDGAAAAGQQQPETAEQQRMRSFLTEWHRRQQSMRAEANIAPPGSDQPSSQAPQPDQRQPRRDIFQRMKQFKDILFGRSADA